MDFGYMIAPLFCTALFGGVGGLVFGILHKHGYLNQENTALSDTQEASKPLEGTSTSGDSGAYNPLPHLHNILIGCMGALIVIALALALTKFSFRPIYTYYYTFGDDNTQTDLGTPKTPESLAGSADTAHDEADTVPPPLPPGLSKPKINEQKALPLLSDFTQTYAVLIGLSLVGGFASIRVFRKTGNELINQMDKLNNRVDTLETITKENNEKFEVVESESLSTDFLILGIGKIDAGDPKEAIKYLHKSIELLATPRAYNLLAYASYDAGQPVDTCIDYVKQGLELAERQPDTDPDHYGGLYYDWANYLFFGAKDNPEKLNEVLPSIISKLQRAVQIEPGLAETLKVDGEMKELWDLPLFQEKFGTIADSDAASSEGLKEME